MIKEKNKDIKLSIIIPIYNSEKYLEECLKSVVTQTYSNFEIILIDDGSTDRSLEIAKNFKKKDSRIILLKQSNSGPGVARNNGIVNSHGDYILFLDSDDYFYNRNNLASIVSCLIKEYPDLLMYNVGTYWEKEHLLIEEGKILRKDVISKMKGADQLFSYLVSKNLVYSGVLAKVLNRKFLMENNLYYPSGQAEDILWSVNIYKKIKRLSWINDTVYIYRKNGESSRSSQPFNHQRLLPVKKICLDIYTNREIYSKGLLSYIAYLYIVWLAQARLSSDEAVKEDYKQIKECKKLLNYDLNPNVKKAKIVSKILGIDILSMILAHYMKKAYRM